MRHTLLTGLAGLSFALGAPAAAQDTGTAVADPAAQTTPAPAPDEPAPMMDDQAPATTTVQDPATDEFPFSGVYVGGSFGYDVQQNDVGSRILFDAGLNGGFGDFVRTGAGADAFSTGFCNGAARGATSAPGCANDRDGIGYYGRVGADYQVSKIVVGVMGEFGKSKISDSISAFSTTPANYVMTREVEWEASIRGRAGFVAGRSTLFYGAFGPGYINLDRSFRSTNTANSFEQRGKRRQFGITGGGGVEQMIGNNFSIGMEYMFHQYDDDRARVRVGTGTAPATNPFVLARGVDFRRSDEKFRWHSIRGTAAFRF
ncbi:outer membrane protein [uncultured Sphingomonas sp.]|uniref:outer membrane protein n=1 Tax=uncultured Sphingomonas sp. TaxID=158754 RepID=UPI0035C986F2